MPGSSPIFISYRREDSKPETERIYEHLIAKFGRTSVFKDVNSIPLGSPFVESLEQALGECQVLLVIIGKHWATIKDANGRHRLGIPDDPVRFEIESALRRKIPIIPIFLEGVRMPLPSQLPESLHNLPLQNGTQVGQDPSFEPDMARLIQALTEIMVQTKPGAHVEVLPNNTSLEMIKVPGGTFAMGSSEGEDGWKNDEAPRHSVEIASFWMSKFPITQIQWDAVANLKPITYDLPLNPSYFSGNENLPVESITWYEACEFCARLSKKTGQSYWLPSEAEWEYSCRANTITPFSFGRTITEKQANFDNHVKRTTELGGYPISNNFELFDMHGNVWEWCLDHWHENYRGAPSDGEAWYTNNKDKERICRGGSWNYDPIHCRSASRMCHSPNKNSKTIGFRVVRKT